MAPGSIQPFQELFKDAYLDAGCVDDFMFTHGDKFGSNKHSYKLGKASNVSIVHYTSHVAKKNRQRMTPDVCFSFCRTIPDMTFFGIRNGRDCYCTPYYQQQAGDSSICDVVCEGAGARICGSATKSSVFGMHMCSENLQSESASLTTEVNDFVNLTNHVSGLASRLLNAGSGMQSAADAHQRTFGKAGDTVATDLMQAAKVHAGELESAANASHKLVTEMMAAGGESGSVLGALAGQPSHDTVVAAEKYRRRVERLNRNGLEAEEDLTGRLQGAKPAEKAGTGKNGSVQGQYASAQYFVDKEAMAMPSTCAGTSARPPFIGSREGCAQACNADVLACVGFSYFPHAGTLAVNEGLCFLLSSLERLTYYTGCGKRTPSTSDPVPVCMVKFSKFEGTTLKPDKTGKCKSCLREATAAARCYK